MPVAHGTTTGRLRRVTLLTAPFATGALITVIAFLALRDALPDRMATHFTLDGTADGFASPSTALAQYLLMLAAEAAGVLAAGSSRRSALTTTRALTVLACGLAAASTYLFVTGLRAGAHTSGPSADLPVHHHLGPALAVGAVVSGVAWLVSRPRHRRAR
ncbi:DUF1648 domain-containing protein [Streptomyces sp. NPDC006385]|uniref:DUF1648 domain-containing protein n=1 Tax=Streptomyces sp. NPDC006385 TaxID=3156761 RepID=UPI0033B72616